MLEAIERANLFLVPLDEVRGWWRYHHLFADLLRARLRQHEPERAARLHRNAAGWADEHGLADEAVRHALAAGDAAWAARLVERYVDAQFPSQWTTLQRWLAALLAGSRPRLLLAQSRLAILNGRLEAAEPALDAAERALAATGSALDEPYEPSVGRAASLLVNVPATLALDRAHLAELRGDAEGAFAYVSRALAEIREGEWMLESHASGYLSLAEWMGGRLAEAERSVSSSIARWQAAGEDYLIARGSHHLGQIQRAQGRLDEAAGTYRRVLETAAPPGRASSLPSVSIGHVGLAEVAYQRGDLDTARWHLDEGLAASRQIAFTQPLATGLATLAWIRQAEGDAAGARDTMGEADQVVSGEAVTYLLNPVPAQRVRLLLAQGDVAAAADWTRERGLAADDEPSYAREPEYLLLARVLLAQGHPDLAQPLLGRLRAVAAAQGRTGSLIEIRALQELALAAETEAETEAGTGARIGAGPGAGGGETGTANAVAALAEAVTLACPRGYVRVFADEGKPMRTLLGRLVAAQRIHAAPARAVSLEYLARLLRAVDAPGAPPPPRARAAVSGLIEPLTAREVEVLGLLAAGRSNRDIAAELVVTLDTVKKHVSHVLDKLGAANRTEAVARARQLGLIP